MRQRRGPKRQPRSTDERHKQNKSKPRKRIKGRSRRHRICPVHNRVLVLRPDSNPPKLVCPEPGCDLRRGPSKTSTVCDADTGRARMLLHDAFDPLWKGRGARMFGNRDSAYKWLAMALGITVRQCHIGMFDIETCKRAAQAITELLKD